MKIFVRDDGKKRYQSWEAWVDNFSVAYYGYGETKEEAIEDLNRQIKQFILDLTYLDYNNVEIKE